MISAGEFRNGITIEYEGDIFIILEFQHVKPGKGAAFVRTKIKNLKTGAVVEKTFRPTEKMPRAHIDRQDMQYLYNDGDLYHFMNTENFEQIAVNAEEIGDTLKFVKENEMVKVCSYNGNVFAIEPPWPSNFRPQFWCEPEMDSFLMHSSRTCKICSFLLFYSLKTKF